MYKEFDTAVEKILATMGDTYYKSTIRRYFADLRNYLSENTLPYSHSVAKGWLSASKDNWVYSKYQVCRSAVYKLNDMITHGELTSVGKYAYDDSQPYYRISSWSRELLESLLDKLSYSIKKPPRTAFSKFLLYLEEHGVNSRDEINFEHFAEYLRYANEAFDDYVQRRKHLRFIAMFMAELLDTDMADLLTKRQGTSAFVFLDDLPRNQKRRFLEAASVGEVDSIPVDEYWKSIREKNAVLKTQGYTKDTLRCYRGDSRSLCLFLLLNNLYYSDELAKCWADYAKRDLIIKHRYHGFEKSELTGGERSVQTLPDWSRELLEMYINSERRRGQAESSLENQRYACVRFLRFLDMREITSCEKITPETLQEFHLTDKHLTLEGKRSGNSRVGRFIDFLAELELVPPTLRDALPCKVASTVRIISTLSEEERALIYRAKDNAKTPIELRDAAMVMLGLRMGLRASDVTNLRLGDISWNNRTITIRQQKTGAVLTLPMPIMVGNCIYRYLRDGRPNANSDNIFVSHDGPRKPLTSHGCSGALNRILHPGKRYVRGYGFHITRRTFATSLLKSGNSVDSISNLLGHNGPHTVMKYVSTDDERMRMCAIPASKVVAR